MSRAPILARAGSWALLLLAVACGGNNVDPGDSVPKGPRIPAKPEPAKDGGAALDRPPAIDAPSGFGYLTDGGLSLVRPTDPALAFRADAAAGAADVNRPVSSGDAESAFFGDAGSTASGSDANTSVADGGRPQSSSDASVGVSSDALVGVNADASVTPRADAGVRKMDGPTRVLDSREPPSPDALPNDAGPDGINRPESCVVTLIPMSASNLSRLPAGADADFVMGAEVSGLDPQRAVAWSWQVRHEITGAVAFSPFIDTPSLISFKLDSAGSYTVVAMASDGRRSCAQNTTATALLVNKRTSAFWIRAVPPLPLPMYYRGIAITSGLLARDVLRVPEGVDVRLDPQAAGGGQTVAVPSYIRMTDPLPPLEVAEGVSSPQAPFVATLQSLGRYDVLVVPLETAAGSAPRFAPRLLTDQTPIQLMNTPITLTPGLGLGGLLLDGQGDAVRDARVSLSYAGHSRTQRPVPVLSTVGRSGTDGRFDLLARGGPLSLSVVPPPSAGLPELTLPEGSSFTLSETSAPPLFDVRWNSFARKAISLRVAKPDGQPAANVRVRLRANLASAGTLRLSPSGDAIDLRGVARFEGITAADGRLSFPPIPTTSYDVLLIPPDDAAAVTSTKIDGDSAAQATLLLRDLFSQKGRLLAEADLTGTVVVATDVGTDVQLAPVQSAVTADGSFSLRLSPGRRYVIVARPAPGLPYAPAFLGIGPVMPNPFVLRKQLPITMSLEGRVVSDSRPAGIGGTVLQVYCDPSEPDCLDSFLPMGEGITDGSGAFKMGLPDPKSR